MKKAINILQGLNSTEKYYNPDKLVDWCNKVGLKTESSFEDKTSWWNVSGN